MNVGGGGRGARRRAAEGQESEADASEAASELLVQMRELAMLQRQLEGLQQTTATLHAALRRAERTPGGGEGGAAQPPESAARRPRANRLADADEAEVEGSGAHPGVTCDGCGAGPPLMGRVMKCLDCEDFDLCQRCYRRRDDLGHPRGHRFQLRAPAPRRAEHPLAMLGLSPDHPLGASGLSPMMAAPPEFMLQLLESAMLDEALRRSAEPDPREVQREAERQAAELLGRLPRVIWSRNTRGGHCEECALCLEAYSPGEEVLKLPCGHLFHEACVGPWFSRSMRCPMCQQELG